MNELKVFQNESFGQVRVIDQDGEPWFIAKDVCDILELSNPTMVVSRLDSDEVTKFNLGGLSGETNLVNEYGLYSLVLGSRKEEAKQFKRWITHDVIPSIRKTGGYKIPTSTTEMFKLALGSIEETNSKVEAVNADLQEFKQDMPILGIECEKITRAARKKGVECLGGKTSKAYQDKSLSQKVYSDIYKQLKREFGISSYREIKRIQSNLAISIIGSYKLPFALSEQVYELNQQMQIS